MGTTLRGSVTFQMSCENIQFTALPCLLSLNALLRQKPETPSFVNAQFLLLYNFYNLHFSTNESLSTILPSMTTMVDFTTFQQYPGIAPINPLA